MKTNIKGLLLIVFCLINTIYAFAQQEYVQVAGTFTQKGNYEITVVGKNDGKTFKAGQYFLDPSTNKFAMAIPFRANTSYEMRVTVKKMGHRRLETDYTGMFPLKLLANKNLNLSLNPALFKQANKGLTIEKLPAKIANVSVLGFVKGVFNGSEISLGKVEEGQYQAIQGAFISKGDSTFNFSLPIEKEGFYYISTLRGKKRLYLKPNDQINLAVDFKTSTEQGNTKTTPENSLIAQWEQLISPLNNLLATPKPNREEFTAVFTALQPKVMAFKQSFNTPNAKFNELFKTAVQVDDNLSALNMLLKSSSEKRGVFIMQSKDFLNVPDYYKQFFNEHKVNTGKVLDLAEGHTYANLMARFSLNNLSDAQRKQLEPAERVKLLMDATANDTLKTAVLKSQLEELEFDVPNYSEFKEVFLPYEKYVNTASVKQKYNGILKMFVADTVFIGKSAYDFTLPDVNGKMVNMKDFAGKVVLIDVWATWCGPCKAQIPFFKEIEEEFKGNDNVVFAGISIDAEKDKQKWIEEVKEKQLAGVQLIDIDKSFRTRYKTYSIPRFFLVNKAGKWAEVRCPLPEKKEKLIKYINRELSRNN